jgi:hypothetical protein
MNIKRIFENKLTYLVIGALITGIITYFCNIRLIEKEYFYKMQSDKQNFVSGLTEMLQKRIYNEEVFIWNLKNDARENTILDSWERYKEITLVWNEQLSNFYFKLDMYFPRYRYTLKDYSNYLKNKISFRDFLQKEIQPDFIPIHGQLVELKKIINKGEKPNQELVINLEKRIKKLHVKIVNYSEALYNALKD